MKFTSWSYYKVLLVVLFVFIMSAEFGPLAFPGFLPIHKLLNLQLGCNIFLSCGIGSSLLFYCFMLEKRLKERYLIAIVGTLLEVFFFRMHLNYMEWYYAFGHIGIGWGLVAYLCILNRAVRSAQERERALESLALASSLPGFSLFSVFVGQLTAIHDATIYDSILYTIEGSFGFQPSAYLSMIGCCCNINYAFFWLIYSWLPAWMVLAQIASSLNAKKATSYPVFAFVFVGALGQVLYLFFPCVGTEVFCGEKFPYCTLPELKDPLQLLAAPLSFPRNTMPSLHLAWILSAFWGIDGLVKTYRPWFLFLLITTLISVFAIGQHYLLDVLVGISFTLVIHSLSVKFRAGNYKLIILCALYGSIVVWGWLFLFKYCSAWSVTHGELVMLGVILTSGGGLYLQRCLYLRTAAILALENEEEPSDKPQV